MQVAINGECIRTNCFQHVSCSVTVSEVLLSLCENEITCFEPLIDAFE